MQDSDPDFGTGAWDRDDEASAIQAIGRAVRMLSMFSEQELELSLGQLTERFGLGKTTTHRYATSLRQCGLLRYDPRTGEGTPRVKDVMRGEIDLFIAAWIARPADLTTA